MIDRRAFVGILVLAPVVRLVSAENSDSPGISPDKMNSPWLIFKDLIEFLPQKFASLVESERRAQLDRRLQELDLTMAKVVLQKLEISNEVSIPGFINIAPVRSYNLSQEIRHLIELLDAIYSALSIREEKTAKDTTAAMKELQKVLYEKWRLKKDYENARASRDPAALVELSERWRKSADSVTITRETLTRVRRQLNNL